MKKNFLLLFCLISGFFFSQEYHFDYKCYNNEKQLQGIYEGSSRINIIYLNSEKKNHLAYDYFFNLQPYRSFKIYDNDVSMTHSFTINEKSEFSSLHFIASTPIRVYQDERKINRVDVKQVAENIWNLSAFPTKKAKKANLELTIQVEKNSFPLRELRFMDLSPNIHHKIYEALREK